MSNLLFNYDHNEDVLTIEGVKYSGEVFRRMAFPKEGQLYQFERHDDVLEITPVHNTMTEQICPTCLGERWVCENHPNKPWNENGCECGAGAPCLDCNPTTGRDDPPRMPPGTTIICGDDVKEH